MTGIVRIIDGDSQQCQKWENPISWSQAGPPGPAGIARAYATVADFPWYSAPELNPARSLNVESVTRPPGITGAYCIRLAKSVGDTAYLVPVVSPIGGSGDPRYATVYVGCDEDGKGIQVNIFDYKGASLNGSFHMIVAN